MTEIRVVSKAWLRGACAAAATKSGIGVIFVVSALLWWICQFHAGALPALAPWDFSFSWFYATVFSSWWYWRGLKRAPVNEQPSRWRTAAFFLGVGTIYAVLQTRFEYLAEHMFFLNRLQHVVMHHLGPFLIALAWPWPTIMLGAPDRVRRLIQSQGVDRLLRIVRQPLLAAFLFVGLIAFWLVPSIHFRAMIDPHLYLVMNWTMVGDGLLFWSVVLDPRDAQTAGISFGLRALLAIGIMFPQILIGAVIAFARTDLYSFYAWCGRIYPSIGALDDQTYGGLIIWIPPAMMSVVSLLLVLNALRRCEERQSPDQMDSSISSSGWTGR